MEYQESIKDRAQWNPCLGNLIHFLNRFAPDRSNAQVKELCGNSRVGILEFGEQDVPTYWKSSADDLRRTLSRSPNECGNLRGRMILVENLDQELLKLLGSELRIDPLFFSLHVSLPEQSMDQMMPHLAVPPSVLESRDYVNLIYHRTLTIKPKDNIPEKVMRLSNVDRKVVLVRDIRGTNIGLAQHCCSVLKVHPDKTFWTCVVLTDSPWLGEYKTKEAQTEKCGMDTSLFAGGYEDFLCDHQTSGHTVEGPSRRSLFKDLIYHWRSMIPEGFDHKEPDLLSLAYFPLQIVAGEWMNYTAIMGLSMKSYEYSVWERSGLSQQLEKLNRDIKQLQKWRRRSIHSLQEIGVISQFIQASTETEQNKRIRMRLLKDYGHLARRMESYGEQLEKKVSFVMSIVSVKEAASINQLTHLAFIFVPLTFVAGIFSMNGEYSPEGSRFWLFVAVSVPVTVVVHLCMTILDRSPDGLFAWFKQVTISTSYRNRQHVRQGLGSPA